MDSEQAKDEARRDRAAGTGVLSTGLSAAYMRARVEVLTKHLLTGYRDILDVAFTPPTSEDTPEQPPTLVDTANKQLAVDVVTMSMIRAAEELMVLTRTMKELWLFGDLDTLAADQTPEEKIKQQKMREDESAVVEGLQRWLQVNSDKIYKTQFGPEDTTMTSD